jgi:hypothetical protein
MVCASALLRCSHIALPPLAAERRERETMGYAADAADVSMADVSSSTSRLAPTTAAAVPGMPEAPPEDDEDDD